VVKLLAKRHPIEFIEQGLVKPLTDPIGLGTLRLRPRVINMLHGQIPFIRMPLWSPTIFCPPIREDSTQRNVGLVKKGHHPVIQQIRCRERGFAIIQFGQPHLTLGVNTRLLIDPPHAFEGADRERILRPTGARG